MQAEQNPNTDIAQEQEQAAPTPQEAEAAQQADTVAAQTNEIEALKAQNADLAEQFLRAKADLENGRRRAEDEVSKARKFAVESFAESLLPVADSLEAGLAIKDGTVEQIREGAQATLRQLDSAFERNKLLAIDPAGQKFAVLGLSSGA